jgi:hypothetical protein
MTYLKSSIKIVMHQDRTWNSTWTNFGTLPKKSVFGNTRLLGQVHLLKRENLIDYIGELMNYAEERAFSWNMKHVIFEDEHFGWINVTFETLITHIFNICASPHVFPTYTFCQKLSHQIDNCLYHCNWTVPTCLILWLTPRHNQNKFQELHKLGLWQIMGSL